MRTILCLLTLACFASCQSEPPATSDCATPGTCDDAAVVAPPPDMALAVCSPACSGAAPWCNDAHNCVVCLTDEHCPAGQVCHKAGNSAQCVAGCADDARCRKGGGSQSCCNMQCIDTSSDAANCGACGMACAPPNAGGKCVGGQCTLGACSAGFGDCDGMPANGCEANLRIDPANCGKCGMACTIPNGQAGCADTCYLKSCQFGWDDCNANVMDGCERSVLADANNCGACGKVCGVAPHAHGMCVTGACVLTCDRGWSDCDGNAQNGCELATDADTNNCGACKKVCPQGLVCLASSCTCPNCQLANAKTMCVNNQCVLDSCLAGYADCDGQQGNGCEVNINQDSNNCGGCGMACPQNMRTCVNGACMMGVDCGNLQRMVVGGVVICYTNQPGTCQNAHQVCEALGFNYRLMCGDDWQPGRTGEGCGNGGSYTAYDMVNQFFKGSAAIGSYSANQYNCVSGGQNGNCNGDAGNSPNQSMNGYYAFCTPKNFFKAANDGNAFAQVCGN